MIGVVISIVVRYGVIIPEVCRNVQEAVLNALRRMTESSVLAVNVHVQGMEMPERHGSGAEAEREGDLA